ncbi:hypothetical protein [Mycoplasmopsis pullorum]|uniref:Uncharacterized protein n=1 Tax=Mycoplasmopsis pullorum TaxID=48003 RepID=A0A1L4FRW4_9BACT|nr:hypothetical protein [Mycoplasmopsis pullorum]APJ38350.1 hypothetical protein BLA55_01515 [Mycoplasmopsis pullorum]TNK82162.1 hypothetical protein C4M80_03425 [Mycoplasmopsis pullorum]TNK82562.1 hypothetical protein C4M94_00435 [Mycoplasmopsis pullorum]TNK83089.1 hypothetical protein C4M93_02950 [Mycoplasmopsis pullorum]TNK84803.1 hypothetical protein C4M81_01245 [Mycoplasmopsis pullorum]
MENTVIQTKTSQELGLSFDFNIVDFHNRHFTIKLGENLRKGLEFSEKYCEWFMEDLLDFLNANNYQLRWDVSRIKFEDLENLRLSIRELEEFKKFLTEKVTNFKIFV